MWPKCHSLKEWHLSRRPLKQQKQCGQNATIEFGLLMMALAEIKILELMWPKCHNEANNESTVSM
jgi:hypothetical protein